MSPKQSEIYLTSDAMDDGMSTPPKAFSPPKQRASPPPPPLSESPVPFTPSPRMSRARRGSMENPDRSLQRKGYLYGSNNSLKSLDENQAESDWGHSSIGSGGSSSPPGGGIGQQHDPASRSPRTVRGVATMHRTMSSPSFSHSGGNSLSPGKQDVPAFKVFVLLLRPRDKIFELIQVEYDPSRATVGDVLDLVPASATEPKLGNQRHVGMMRTSDGTELTDLALPASPSVFSADGPTANVSRGEILVAIPEGYNGEKCRQLSDKILRNPKMVRLLRRKDPLKPKRSRNRSGGSVSSMSSDGSRLSDTSSVGSFKRRGSSRRVACVPPTVMEEEDTSENDPAHEKHSSSTSGGGSPASPSGKSISMHSLDTAKVRNHANGTLPRELDAIAELLSKDNEAEKRRRAEEERARAAVQDRNRKELEARMQAEAEERIRGEIERKARERVEEDLRREKEAASREEEQRMVELARKAEQAERAWEKVTSDDAPPSPPASPAGSARSLPRRSFAVAAAQASAPITEIEVPAEAPVKSGVIHNGGLEMFFIGMISSAVMVALAARVINTSHPQVPVVVVQETAAAATSQQAPEGQQQQDRTAYYFALFVFLQVIIVVLAQTKAGRKIGRKLARGKIARKLRQLRGGSASNVGFAAEEAPLRRTASVASLAGSANGNSARLRSRSTLAAATQAAAKRSDYGYGKSGGGHNWRKAANL